MADSLQITMLPAKEGDCLMVAYGEGSDKKFILIDSGRAWTYKNALKQYHMQNQITEIELLVITHVDRDHIDGILSFLKDPDLHPGIKNVWFNTYDHLLGLKIIKPETDDETEEFGAKMGEKLSTEILAINSCWNTHFAGKAVELENSPANNEVQLGDTKLTLLSPDREKLVALIPDWKKECQDAGITPGYSVEDYIVRDNDIEVFGGIDIETLAEEEFSEDSSPANGSSIAFILEYKTRKILLSGDAHEDLLVKSLKNYGARPDKPITVDAFKIPHHGSKYNVSKELLSLVKCDHYLISTNGNYFKHPDDVAIARIIKYGTSDATINFNYKSPFNEIWKNSDWFDTYNYSTKYPEDNEDGYLSLEFTTS